MSRFNGDPILPLGSIPGRDPHSLIEVAQRFTPPTPGSKFRLGDDVVRLSALQPDSEPEILIDEPYNRRQQLAHRLQAGDFPLRRDPRRDLYS